MIISDPDFAHDNYPWQVNRVYPNYPLQIHPVLHILVNQIPSDPLVNYSSDKGQILPCYHQCELVPARNVSKFIMDKLDELDGKRHRIAHSADTNQVTREDILGYIDFIHSVIHCLDIVLVKHFDEIIQNN